MNYGIGYKGSKNLIAEWVVEHLPVAAHFYDLFAGGGAITHAAILSRKWDSYIMNDIEPGLTSFFMDAVHGRYRDESRWISRDDFVRLKDTDLYVRYYWSFGTNGANYLYGKDLEAWKRALHYAVFFRDVRPLEAFDVHLPSGLLSGDTVYARYLAMKAFLHKVFGDKKKGLMEHAQSLQSLQRLQRLQSLQSLQRLQSLQSLQRLQRLQRLQATCCSYEDVVIQPNSVVYCDIPYRMTSGYVAGDFDWERFYEWALRQPELVIVSEYSMPSDFVCVAAKTKIVTMSANCVDKKLERLFVPAHQVDRYYEKIRRLFYA